MARLILPPQHTQVFRRAASDLSGPGVWHFTKDDRERITLCGNFITHIHKIEISKLEKVLAADLCDACWRFGKDDMPIIEAPIFHAVGS